jgi:N-acetyl-anhydromuramyl-L-alanine amidase AmpD
MRSINTIVIHCSASQNGVAISPAQIDAWHKARGFARKSADVKRYRPELPHIGYHWLVLADGRVQAGRDKSEIGAHVAGHNANSIGICMIGTDVFFAAQWKALADLLGTIAFSWFAPRTPYPYQPQQVVRMFAQNNVRIVGHRDLSPDLNGDGVIQPNEWLKRCPGFQVSSWLEGGMRPLPGTVLDDVPAINNHSALTRLGGTV